jgi:5-methylthioadenosine/S-adenosylhomocysteine deaminase
LHFLRFLLKFCDFARPPEVPVSDVLISGGIVVTMDPGRRLIEDGAVLVRDDSIAAVGPESDLVARFLGRKIDARGKLVLPGFVNAHAHAAMSLFRGIADDHLLNDWLQKYIFPAEAGNVSEEFVTWGTRLGMLEMIRGGITTFADMYYFEDAVAQAAKEAGMRGVLAQTIVDFAAPDCRSPAAALKFLETYLAKWHGDSLITAAAGPHSIYTVSEGCLRETAALARQHKAPILIHLAEGKFESEYAQRKHGCSPVRYAEKIGLLGADVTAAHCIWEDEADIVALADHRVGCAHNPSSNMKLASGTMPVLELREAGVAVGLATDGAASNNRQDMFFEMDLAAKLQKLSRMDPRSLPAREVVEMATIESARALHLEKKIGSIEEGKQADLILIDLSAPHATPMYNVYSQLVYALKASDVCTVMIAGKIVMEDRKMLTLAEEEILSKAQVYRRQVADSLLATRSTT